ncbi:MAG: hypothetical protein ACRCWF_13860 [Beijerinckiaceae bacterium]
MSTLYSEVFETDVQSKLRNPEASFALSHWTISRRGKAMPEESAFDIASLDWLKQDVMIIKPDEAGDLIYSYYGSRIALHAGFDMSGKRVKDFKGALGDFYQDIYERVMRDPHPVGTVHRLGHFKERPMWERVILPVAKEEVFSALYVVNRVLDLDHEFNLAAARARNSGIIALQFTRDESNTITSGIIIGANKAARDMTGRRLDELIDVSIHTCFPGIVEKGLWQKYLDVSASQKPINLIIEYNLDGMSGTFDVTLSPFRDGVLIDFFLC